MTTITRLNSESQTDPNIIKPGEMEIGVHYVVLQVPSEWGTQVGEPAIRINTEILFMTTKTWVSVDSADKYTVRVRPLRPGEQIITQRAD